MQNTDSEVLWIELLPDAMKGGPMSKFQQRLKESRSVVPIGAQTGTIANPGNAPSPMGCGGSIKMASGGSVHTEKFKHLAEKLKSEGRPAKSAFPIAMHALGYEASVRAGHRRKPGYGVGGYTGDEGDKVLADKVNAEKTFVDHEGEYYINAPMANMLGGPEEIEKLIIERAKARVNAAGPGQNQVRPALPIMAEKDKDATTIPKSNLRSSFAGGGTAYDPEKAAIEGQYIPGTPNVMEQTADIAEHRASHASILPAPAPLAEQPKLGDLRTITLPNGNTVTQQYSTENEAWGLAGSTVAPQVPTTPSMPTPDAPTYAAPMSYEFAPPPATPAAKPPTLSGQRDIDYATSFLRDLAEGKNPVLAGIINSMLQKHGANTAAGKSELQMRLGQEGISGEAADAAMESYDRNARIGRSQIETAGMQQQGTAAQTAAGQLLTAGTAERSFDVSQTQTALANALNSGTFEGPGGYKELYQKLYGTVPDVATFQQAFNDNKFNTARSAIASDLATNPALTIDSPKVGDYLQRMWEGQGGQGLATDSWKTEQFQSIKNTEDPVWQYSHSLSDGAVLDQWFGGDRSDLDIFSYGGKTGIDAFRAYVPELMKGAVKMATDPTTGAKTFTIDYDNAIVKKYFQVREPGTVATPVDPGKPITSYAVGNVFDKVDGADRKVTAIGSDGKPSKISDGKQVWNVTYNDAGTASTSLVSQELSTADGPVTFGEMPLLGSDGKQVTLRAGKFYDSTGKEVTIDPETLVSGMPKVSPVAALSESKPGDVLTVTTPSGGALTYVSGNSDGTSLATTGGAGGKLFIVSKDGKTASPMNMDNYRNLSSGITDLNKKRELLNGVLANFPTDEAAIKESISLVRTATTTAGDFAYPVTPTTNAMGGPYNVLTDDPMIGPSTYSDVSTSIAPKNMNELIASIKAVKNAHFNDNEYNSFAPDEQIRYKDAANAAINSMKMSIATNALKTAGYSESSPSFAAMVNEYASKIVVDDPFA